MIDTITDFLWKYSGMLVGLLLLTAATPLIPMKARDWLFAGTGRREYGRAEAFCLRLAFAYVVWQCFTIRTHLHFNETPHAQGLAHFVDVTFLGDPVTWNTVVRWTNVALIWYIIGWGAAIPLTFLTLTHVAARSLFMSQGSPHHGYQLVSLVLLAQTLVAWVLMAGRTVAWTRHKWNQALWPKWARLGNWTYHWLFSAAAIASAYVITGVTKLDESDGKWLSNSHYFAGQIVKTYRQNFYNELDPRFDTGVAPVPQETPDPQNDRYRLKIPAQAQWMRDHPSLTRIFFGMGLLMELTAFLLIFSRGLSLIYGAVIIGFHFGVLWLMELTFPQNIEVAFIFLVNLPGWIIWLIAKRLGKIAPEITGLPAIVPGAPDPAAAAAPAS